MRYIGRIINKIFAVSIKVNEIELWLISTNFKQISELNLISRYFRNNVTTSSFSFLQLEYRF